LFGNHDLFWFCLLVLAGLLPFICDIWGRSLVDHSSFLASQLIGLRWELLTLLHLAHLVLVVPLFELLKLRFGDALDDLRLFNLLHWGFILRRLLRKQRRNQHLILHVRCLLRSLLGHRFIVFDRRALGNLVGWLRILLLESNVRLTPFDLPF
jgi:hypothetical protein